MSLTFESFRKERITCCFCNFSALQQRTLDRHITIKHKLNLSMREPRMSIDLEWEDSIINQHKLKKYWLIDKILKNQEKSLVKEVMEYIYCEDSKVNYDCSECTEICT